MRVFLSYRRADDVFLAGRLRDRLAEVFGDENVFFDVDSIPPGTDFREVIRERIDAAHVALALIGPRWDANKLAGKNDYVRMELVESLRQGKPLIPVLIADTAMPRAEELPDELSAMAFLNALRLRPDPDFHPDSDRLVDAVVEANERELAGDVEQERVRTPGVENAAGRRRTGQAELVALRAQAAAAQTARVAADADVARLRAEHDSVGPGRGVADLEAEILEAESNATRRREEALAARQALVRAEAEANRLRSEEETASQAPTNEQNGDVQSSGYIDFERPPAEDTVVVGPDRGPLRQRRRWIAAGVAVAFVVVTTMVVLVVRRSEDSDAPGDQLGRWLAQVRDDDVDVLRSEGGARFAGKEAAWNVNEQLLAYVSARGDECGICGVERGSDEPVVLVEPVSDGSELHAPAWSERTGALYYARTKDCTPGPTCGDQIFRIRPGSPSSNELLWSNLHDVVDLEVDPWTSTNNVEDIRVAVVDVDGAKLMDHKGNDIPLANGGDVRDLTYSANGNVIAGLPNPGRPELEFWTRDGESIETVDLNQLLSADGVNTGLEIGAMLPIAVSATGQSFDQKFVVALSDSSEIAAVEIEIPYNPDPALQQDATPRAKRVPLPFALYRDGELTELIAIRQFDS